MHWLQENHKKYPSFLTFAIGLMEALKCHFSEMAIIKSGTILYDRANKKNSRSPMRTPSSIFEDLLQIAERIDRLLRFHDVENSKF